MYFFGFEMSASYSDGSIKTLILDADGRSFIINNVFRVAKRRGDDERIAPAKFKDGIDFIVFCYMPDHLFMDVIIK